MSINNANVASPNYDEYHKGVEFDQDFISGGRCQKNKGGQTFKTRLFTPFSGKNYKKAILEKQAKIKKRRGKCPFCLHVRPPLDFIIR